MYLKQVNFIKCNAISEKGQKDGIQQLIVSLENKVEGKVKNDAKVPG